MTSAGADGRLAARRRRTVVGLLLGVVALGVPAAVGAGASPVSAPAAVRAAIAAGSLPVGCTWYGETDQRDVNIGAPDLDAFYWLTPVPAVSGTQAVIAGEFPHARYFSFHVYDETGTALDSVYDQQIDPLPGSANPYRGPVRPGRGDTYRVRVAFAARPAHPAPDTLYADPTVDGHPFPVALLVYRVYVPANPADPSGNVPFPHLTVETSSGRTLLAEQACSTTPPAGGSLVWERLAATDYPADLPVADSSAASAVPVWQRQFGSALGNQQNAYLATVISRQYGQIVVIHAKAPSFPNSRAGQPVYGHDQLRYWSFCTYNQTGQAAVGCAADYAAAIRDGSLTYVVSDPGDRPANATAAHGVTWLPWGGFQATAQIVYRTMLPASWFTHAAQRVTSPSESAESIMGAYYPTAAYCSVATFTRGGWQACFAADHETAGAATPDRSGAR